MIRLVLGLSLLGACSEADEALRALDQAKAAACACKPGDVACTKDAEAKLAAWQSRYGKTDGSAAQAAKAQADLKAAKACLAE